MYTCLQQVEILKNLGEECSIFWARADLNEMTSQGGYPNPEEFPPCVQQTPAGGKGWNLCPSVNNPVVFLTWC